MANSFIESRCLHPFIFLRSAVQVLSETCVLTDRADVMPFHAGVAGRMQNKAHFTRNDIL